MVEGDAIVDLLDAFDAEEFGMGDGGFVMTLRRPALFMSLEFGFKFWSYL
jgi:hypothetical protein